MPTCPCVCHPKTVHPFPGHTLIQGQRQGSYQQPFYDLCPKRSLSHTVRMIQSINTQLQRMTAQLSSEDDCVIPVPEKKVQSHGYSGLENGNILIFKMGKGL